MEKTRSLAKVDAIFEYGARCVVNLCSSLFAFARWRPAAIVRHGHGRSEFLPDDDVLS